MKRSFLLSLVVVAAMWALAVEPTRAADAAPPAQGGAVATVGPAQPGVVKYSPKMSAGALAGRPDSDLVELPNGRRVKLGDVRRLTAAARRMRGTTPGSKLPKAFRMKPAATGTPLKSASDLSAALKRPDSDTVVLPSGRRVTVGMIRLFQPEVEKRLGRSLAGGAKPADRSGPAIKVGKKTDWKGVLDKPDVMVLEAPDGSRITVRELRQALAAAPPARRLPPAKKR